MTAGALQVSRFLTVLADPCDALNRFHALAALCGWPAGNTDALEVTTGDRLDADDEAAARRFGGTIKYVLWAACDGDRIEAFAGPALVTRSSALTPGGDEPSGFELAGRYELPVVARESTRRAASRTLTTPNSEWLVRLRFPGVTPHVDLAPVLVERVGLTAIAAIADARTHWVRVASVPRVCTENAIRTLRHLHRVDVCAIRAL